MNQSPTIGALAAALAKAQGDFPPVVKGKTAKAGPYSYDYADLADIIAALQPALAANELSIVQDASVEFVNGGPVAEVCTSILHSSGEWLTTGAIRIASADASAQKIGAVLTYARRYSYGAALCISPEADTDGADQQVDRKPGKAPKPQAPPPAGPSRTAAQLLWSAFATSVGDDAKAKVLFDKAATTYFGVKVPSSKDWTEADVLNMNKLLFP
jgi:hypothetical protein